MKLALRNVSKTFHENNTALLAVDDVSFTVQPGEFVTMIVSSTARY